MFKSDFVYYIISYSGGKINQFYINEQILNAFTFYFHVLFILFSNYFLFVYTIITLNVSNVLIILIIPIQT